MIIAKNLLLVILILIISLIIMIWYEETTKKKLPIVIPPIGIVSFFTFLWILFILNLAINQKTHIDLNNWGDFLAGFFAPILFIWVVYGIFIQQKEFSTALNSFESQYKEMQTQNAQIEIQQLNTWFNRNTTTINMLKNIIMKKEKSIQEIYNIISNDIKEHSTYFETYDEIKNLLEIDLYIKDYLHKIITNTQSNKILITSVNDIQNEYDVLFKTDIEYSKKILKLVYFFIYAHKNKEFQSYATYKDWIKGYEKNYEEIFMSHLDSEITITMKKIAESHEKIQINFKTGEIDGSI